MGKATINSDGDWTGKWQRHGTPPTEAGETVVTVDWDDANEKPVGLDHTSKKLCRDAITAARAATAMAGVTFSAPANSTLDGVAVSVGSEQTTYIDHPDPTEGREYWPRMLQAGSDVLPEFDCINGRFVTDANGMAAIIAEIRPTLATLRTNGRRLENSYRTATTSAQYDAIRDSL